MALAGRRQRRPPESQNREALSGGLPFHLRVADVAAYHDALKTYRVAGILYGHTHQRRIFAWDGTPPGKTAPENGIPVFNTDNAAHFKMEDQAFLHFQVTTREIIGREYATADGWQRGSWTPQLWRFPLRT